MCKWQVEYVLNYEMTHVLRYYVHWVVGYESYNHTTIRPFKIDELMRDEYYDGIHCGNPVSQNYLENNWVVTCFVFCIDRVCGLKCFLGGPESGGRCPNGLFGV